MKKLFQSAKPTLNLKGQECISFSLTGNGEFGNVVRTGWKESKLTKHNTAEIIRHLEDPSIDKVYRRGRNYYKFSINGVESPILGTKGGVRQL